MIGFLLKIKDLFDFGRKVFCPCCQCEFRAKRKNSYMIPTWGGYKLTHDCPYCGTSIVYGKVRNEKNGRY